jgi:hypothetical protein
MRNTILGIIALGVLGACNSEPKDEVGRYVPVQRTNTESILILDTKTGTVYEGIFKDSSLYFAKINLAYPDVKKAKINISYGFSGFKSKTYE